jgi:hypothetical protein
MAEHSPLDIVRHVQEIGKNVRWILAVAQNRS